MRLQAGLSPTCYVPCPVCELCGRQWGPWFHTAPSGRSGRGASCLRLFHAPVQAVAYLSLRKESSHLPTPANSKPSKWGQPCSLCMKGIEGLADLTFLHSQMFPVISSHAVRTQAEGLCSRLPKRWDLAVLCSSPTGPTSLGSKISVCNIHRPWSSLR